MLSTMISTAIKAAQKAASSTKKSSSSSSGSSSGSSGSSGSSSVAFDKDFDYAEAIANTSDPVKRAQLLQARQAKIDALGLEGLVGSNEAVSQWSGSYRPYWVSSGNSSSISVNGLYEAAAKARLQAFNTAKQNIQDQLESQYKDIDRSYRQGMTQAEDRKSTRLNSSH